jgi:hypothetical protein
MTREGSRPFSACPGKVGTGFPTRTCATQIVLYAGAANPPDVAVDKRRYLRAKKADPPGRFWPSGRAAFDRRGGGWGRTRRSQLMGLRASLRKLRSAPIGAEFDMFVGIVPGSLCLPSIFVPGYSSLGARSATQPLVAGAVRQVQGWFKIGFEIWLRRFCGSNGPGNACDRGEWQTCPCAQVPRR